MRNRHVWNRVGLLAMVLVLLAGAVQLQAMRERLYPPSTEVDDSLYVTSGPALRRMTASLNALASDLYWIRAIQYYGGAKRRLEAEPLMPAPPPLLAATSEYEQLYPLLDIATSLDPLFTIAYRFGSVFLAEEYPRGPGRPDLAVRLLEKGLSARPDKWEYMQDIGFVHYWYNHDYRAAADWFRKTSEVPGAPWWLKSLAATTLAQGGDRRSSRTMWQAIRESAEVDWLRGDAERRLAQLDALDQIEALQRFVDQYAAKTGEAATDWRSLVRAGAIGGIPLDPARIPYEITTDGRVRLSQASPLWPLPQEPEATARPAS